MLQDSHKIGKMHTHLPIVVNIVVMTAAIGVFRGYPILGIRSYMQSSLVEDKVSNGHLKYRRKPLFSILGVQFPFLLFKWAIRGLMFQLNVNV